MATSQLNAIFGGGGELGLCLCHRSFLGDMLDTQQRLYVEAGLSACGTPFSAEDAIAAACEVVPSSWLPLRPTGLSAQQAVPAAESEPSSEGEDGPPVPPSLSAFLTAHLATSTPQPAGPDPWAVNTAEATADGASLPQWAAPRIRLGSYSERTAALEAAGDEEVDDAVFRRFPAGGGLASAFQREPGEGLAAQYRRAFINPYGLAGAYPRPGVMYTYDAWGELAMLEALYPAATALS
eukprot:jgi/Tetstr1/453238/TSEL_040254.t1